MNRTGKSSFYDKVLTQWLIPIEFANVVHQYINDYSNLGWAPESRTCGTQTLPVYGFGFEDLPPQEYFQVCCGACNGHVYLQCNECTAKTHLEHRSDLPCCKTLRQK
jgi:hypothetical protein